MAAADLQILHAGQARNQEYKDREKTNRVGENLTSDSKRQPIAVIAPICFVFLQQFADQFAFCALVLPSVASHAALSMEITVWLLVTVRYRQEKRMRWRISFGANHISHFDPIHHFLGRAAKDRLDAMASFFRSRCSDFFCERRCIPATDIGDRKTTAPHSVKQGRMSAFFRGWHS